MGYFVYFESIIRGFSVAKMRQGYRFHMVKFVFICRKWRTLPRSFGVINLVEESLLFIFLAKNDSNDDGKNFVEFHAAGMFVCDRKIALLILRQGEMEPPFVRLGGG